MKIINVESKKQKKEFINFIYTVYKNDRSFKDTLISVVKTFLNKSDTFTKESYVRPISVINDRDDICAQCIFVHNEELNVLQIGFFDALREQEKAIDIILGEAKFVAKQLNLERIIIGLNGHVSYGVGFLSDQFDAHIPFDSLYNKDYYIEYFEKYNLNKKTLTTYAFKMDHIQFRSRINTRIHNKYTYRTLNLKRFKEEMILFGDLCNETLKNTPLYFPRKPVCMYELLKDLKPFLKPCNLIFAMKDGKEIGFVFWHPDYNEIIPGGKKNSMLEIGFRFLFHRNKIENIVINAVGILEPYKRTSVAMGLFYEVYKVTKDKYIGGESNFVFDSNIDSSLLNKVNMDKESRHYCVYEMKV